MNGSKPHYGYYALPIFTILSAVLIFSGVIVVVIYWWLAGSILIGLGIYFVISYAISMRLFKETESTDPSPILELKGDEKVLDVGCGLGKMTVGIAKHLNKGKVIGIDIWNKVELPGNSPERAYANAEVEGVRNRVDFKTGNVLSVPFPDSSFNVVTSSSVINNFHSEQDRLKALLEIYRVLRPGGRFLLLEPLRDSWEGILIFSPFFSWMILPKNRWIEYLRKAGFVNLRYDKMRAMGAFLVEKPM